MPFCKMSMAGTLFISSNGLCIYSGRYISLPSISFWVSTSSFPLLLRDSFHGVYEPFWHLLLGGSDEPSLRNIGQQPSSVGGWVENSVYCYFG